MPVMLTLLVRWWFTNCPARRGLAMAFVIISCSPGSVVVTRQEQIAALGSSVVFVGRDVGDLDPRLRGHGPWWPSRS
jgi:hypothetical protein